MRKPKLAHILVIIFLAHFTHFTHFLTQFLAVTPPSLEYLLINN